MLIKLIKTLPNKDTFNSILIVFRDSKWEHRIATFMG